MWQLVRMMWLLGGMVAYGINVAELGSAAV